MENFFGHLMEEMFHRQEFTDIEKFTTELRDYIRWYNAERISLTLECLSTMEYRAQALAAETLIYRVHLSGPSSPAHLQHRLGVLLIQGLTHDRFQIDPHVIGGKHQCVLIS